MKNIMTGQPKIFVVYRLHFKLFLILQLSPTLLLCLNLHHLAD